MKAQVLALYARVEDAHATLPPTACRAGCDHCCHLPVDASAVEVVTLAQHLHDTRDAAAIARLQASLQEFAAVLAATPARERMALRRPCPLLVDRKCSAYEARPLSCRAFHSNDVERCITATKPENVDAGFRFPDRRRLEVASHAGALLADGARRAGRDLAIYNLVEALAVALASPDATRERWESGEAVFPAGTRRFEDRIEAGH